MAPGEGRAEPKKPTGLSQDETQLSDRIHLRRLGGSILGKEPVPSPQGREEHGTSRAGRSQRAEEPGRK